MGPLPSNESRRHVRRPLVRDLTGRLLVGSGGRPVSCFAADVSSGGLRILAHEELPPGAVMVLAVEGFSVPMVVVWCQPDAESIGSFCCGLMSTGDTDLEMFFVSIGWLGDDQITEEWIRGLEQLVNAADKPGRSDCTPQSDLTSARDVPNDVGPISSTTRKST
jgi:hypothetical protein